MYRLLLLAACFLLPAMAFSKSQLAKKEVISNCGNHQLTIVSYELDSHLPAHTLSKDSAGHYGNPYLAKQNLVFRSNAGETHYSIKAIWPQYGRIDPTRFYSASIKQCSQENGAFIAFWSGGNCRDVCEAWSQVKFNDDGSIKSNLGLSYAEFKQGTQTR